MRKCEVCAAQVQELRRGRCWGCYIDWTESRPVGSGAACMLCGDRRHEHLRTTELYGALLPTCHNCAARARRLKPMPATLSELRRTLSRDRRLGDRRNGDRDRRILRLNRRKNERRDATVGEPDIVVDEASILDSESLERLPEDLFASGPEVEETGVWAGPDRA